MTDITELAPAMKAAAEKATALNLDTAQEVRDEDGYLECPVCGGEGSVDAERDYCNIDGVALGIQFYGIGEHHGLAEQYFRIATPANILALVEALEKSESRLHEVAVACATAEQVMEKAQTINAAAEKLVRCKGRYHSEQNYRALAALFGVTTPDLPPPLGGESRTVTVRLPSKIERGDADGWFMYNGGRVGGGAAEWYNKALDDVGAELTAAGIKWEAE
ncbi:ead/Ea22-like family protein [Raoultella sp. HC6]|uniref:ead/Ea22-like family protein n=1 Tax=Raoultella sp. HC6 TaxID=2923366 RepID=UPI001F50A039|nr:ead/Ea22-like family protein [Raoultella sp. HC6]